MLWHGKNKLQVGGRMTEQEARAMLEEADQVGFKPIPISSKLLIDLDSK